MKAERPVLVIEDDPDVRRLLVERVRNDGYRTLEAASGEEGLAMARTETPCLVLLDLLLPEMNGWEVLAQLRGDAAFADTPVVIVSILDELLPHPIIEGYMVKPFRGAEVHTVLQELADHLEEVPE
jgi:CheY-like chemotaxis protein